MPRINIIIKNIIKNQLILYFGLQSTGQLTLSSNISVQILSPQTEAFGSSLGCEKTTVIILSILLRTFPLIIYLNSPLPVKCHFINGSVFTIVESLFPI